MGTALEEVVLDVTVLEFRADVTVVLELDVVVVDVVLAFADGGIP